MPPQLPDSRYLLANLMNNLSDAVYFKDMQSRFVMMNRACIEKHGWKSAEFIAGKTDFDVFSREHAEQAFADEQLIIETGESLRGVEEKETWPDGRVTWVSSTKMPLKNAAGEIIGTFGISRDITEHKEAELRALHYAEEMRLITEGMEEEARMAAEMQKNFSPSNFPVYPPGAAPGNRCVDFLHRSVLCGQVSGDYCTIVPLSPFEVGIFLCDIRGAGIRAALGTALVRGVIQEVEVPYHGDPGLFLSRVSQLLRPLLFRENLLLDITACGIILNVSTGLLKVASAEHPKPLCFHAGQAAHWLLLEASCHGPALASVDEFSYVTTECQMTLGDSVVLFTDGLFSARNSALETYGEGRVIESAGAFAGNSLAGFIQKLEGDALDFSADGKFGDDVCFIGFQLNKLLERG